MHFMRMAIAANPAIHFIIHSLLFALIAESGTERIRH